MAATAGPNEDLRMLEAVRYFAPLLYRLGTNAVLQDDNDAAGSKPDDAS